MDIETSKLTKTSIESPSLKTNRLIAYDDILIRNSSLGRIFGSVEPAQEIIDVRKMTDESSYGAEQIHAFRCGVSEFTHDRIKSVTLRMSPNDNSTNSSTSQQQAVWMFVRCLDEHMNEMNDTPIISLAPVQQTTRETTWEFEPFIILPEYKVLEFRITTDKEDLNITPANYTNTLRSANLSSNNKKFYISDWKTVNQIGGVELFTTDFAIEVLRATTPFDGLMESLNDNELKINNHTQNSSIHVSEDQMASIAKIDSLEENITSFDNHISDETIHLNDETKNVLIEASSMVDYVYDERELRDNKLFDLSSQSTLTKPAQGIIKAQICSQHAIEGTALIKQARIPQCTNSLDSEYTFNTPLYLVIYGDTTGNNDFEFVTISNNTQIQIKGGEDMIFTFDENVNIGGYKKYRLFYSLSNETTPLEPTTSEDYASYPKMAFNGFTIDRDCCVWQSNGTAVYNYTLPIYIDYVEVNGKDLLHKNNQDVHVNAEYKSQIAKISDLEKDLKDFRYDIYGVLPVISKHVNDSDDIHLSKKQAEDISLIAPHIEDKTIHVTQSHLDMINEIEEGIYDSKAIVEERVYDNSPLSTGTKAAQGITKVQICSEHMIEGTAIIKRAIIPQNTSASSSEFTSDTPLYLVIYGDTTGEDTFDFICTSNNTQVQIKGGEDMIFTFDENINIGDYKKYRLFYTTDISSTPLEPTTLEDYSNAPKMAFNALTLDRNCIIWQSNGASASTYTFPIVFEYTFIDGVDLLHKNNTSVHLNQEQIEMMDSLSDMYNHTRDEVAHLTEDERNILIVPGYSYSNVNESDTLDNYKTHGFQLGNLHIKPGFIKQVRIPYSTYNINLEEIGGTFYLAVQVFKNGDPDTASDNKSLKETTFSINTHTISVAETSEYVFDFENLEIPNEFKFVRFMLTTSKSVLPNGYSIANCAKMRVRPVKKNGTDFREFDTDECKLLVGTGGSTQKFMAAAHFEYRPETKPIITQKISSYKWRVEAGNIDYTTLDEICDALMNTHKASIFVTAQKYNVYNFNNDFGYGDLNTTEKTNFIFEITYPKLMDVYEVVKTVYSNYYENSHYPKIYPIFN